MSNIRDFILDDDINDEDIIIENPENEKIIHEVFSIPWIEKYTDRCKWFIGDKQ